MEVLQWSHLKDLPLADPNLDGKELIQLIIIGVDLYGATLLDGLRKGNINETTGQNTIFGWILSGPIGDNNPSSVVSAHVVSLGNIDATLKRLWELKDASLSITPEEQECKNYFVRIHTRTHTGRYIVRLPFTVVRRPTFGKSRDIALTHFHRLEARLNRDSDLKREYTDFLQEYEDLGHMESIDRNSPTAHCNA